MDVNCLGVLRTQSTGMSVDQALEGSLAVFSTAAGTRNRCRSLVTTMGCYPLSRCTDRWQASVADVGEINVKVKRFFIAAAFSNDQNLPLEDARPRRSIRADPPQSALAHCRKIWCQFGAKYSPEYRFLPPLPAYNLFRMCSRPIRHSHSGSRRFESCCAHQLSFSDSLIKPQGAINSNKINKLSPR
jgi:hypothetical protein